MKQEFEDERIIKAENVIFSKLRDIILYYKEKMR